MYRYPALIDGEAGRYGVTFPDLPRVVAMGSTIEEPTAHAESALRDYAIEAKMDGSVPRPPTAIENVKVPSGVAHFESLDKAGSTNANDCMFGQFTLMSPAQGNSPDPAPVDCNAEAAALRLAGESSLEARSGQPKGFRGHSIPMAYTHLKGGDLVCLKRPSQESPMSSRQLFASDSRMSVSTMLR